MTIYQIKIIKLILNQNQKMGPAYNAAKGGGQHAGGALCRAVYARGGRRGLHLHRPEPEPLRSGAHIPPGGAGRGGADDGGRWAEAVFKGAAVLRAAGNVRAFV